MYKLNPTNNHHSITSLNLFAFLPYCPNRADEDDDRQIFLCISEMNMQSRGKYLHINSFMAHITIYTLPVNVYETGIKEHWTILLLQNPITLAAATLTLLGLVFSCRPWRPRPASEPECKVHDPLQVLALAFLTLRLYLDPGRTLSLRDLGCPLFILGQGWGWGRVYPKSCEFSNVVAWYILTFILRQ